MNRLTLLGGGNAAGGGLPAGPATILTGLIGWWDASVTASLTLSGATVTRFADQSGLANNLGDGTTTSKPTYSATGLDSQPAVSFASSQFLQTTSTLALGTGNTVTVFAVATLSSAAAGYGRLLSYRGSGATHDYDNVGSFCLDRVSTNAQVQLERNGSGSAGATIAYLTPCRIIGTFNSSGVRTIYINGVATTGTASAGNWVSNGLLNLGISVGDPYNWTGAVAEAGIATGYSDATTAAALDLYLKNKWGLGIGPNTSFDPATTFETSVTNGYLKATRIIENVSIYGGARSIAYKTTGKYYFETTVNAPLTSGPAYSLGILRDTGTYQNFASDGTNCFMVTNSGGIYSNNASAGSLGSSFAVADKACFAIDLTARLGWVRKNGGNWNGSGTADPATGTGGFTIGSGSFAPAIGFASFSTNANMTGNFGQTAYANTAPSGFGNWTA